MDGGLLRNSLTLQCDHYTLLTRHYNLFGYRVFYSNIGADYYNFLLEINNLATCYELVKTLYAVRLFKTWSVEDKLGKLSPKLFMDINPLIEAKQCLVTALPIITQLVLLIK